jgi:hypothetical protein
MTDLDEVDTVEISATRMSASLCDRFEATKAFRPVLVWVVV